MSKSETQFEIPSQEEHLRMLEEFKSLRPTHVEITLRVTGGNMVDGSSATFHCPRVELTRPGQLQLKLEEDVPWDLDYGWDSLPPEPEVHLSIKLDRGELKYEEGGVMKYQIVTEDHHD